MTINISPVPPLGPYPQDRLCGQTGITPNSASTRMMSKIVPIDMIQPPEIIFGSNNGHVVDNPDYTMDVVDFLFVYLYPIICLHLDVIILEVGLEHRGSFVCHIKTRFLLRTTFPLVAIYLF